eukprot:14946993-Ditylum_brightwellii.AAC.1
MVMCAIASTFLLPAAIFFFLSGLDGSSVPISSSESGRSLLAFNAVLKLFTRAYAWNRRIQL